MHAFSHFCAEITHLFSQTWPNSLVQVCLTVPYLRGRGRAAVVEWAESAAQSRVDKSCESFWCEVWIAPPVGEKRRRCLRRLFRFDCLSASAVTIPCRETENDSVLTLFSSAPLLLFYTLGGSHLCPVWSLLVRAQLSPHNNQLARRASSLNISQMLFLTRWFSSIRIELIKSIQHLRYLYTDSPSAWQPCFVYRHELLVWGMWSPCICLNKNIVIWRPLGVFLELGLLASRQCFTSTT